MSLLTHFLWWLNRGRRCEQHWKSIMLSLEAVNANLTTLNASVAAAVTALQNGNPGITQADLDAVAAQIGQAAQTLTAATPPR